MLKNARVTAFTISELLRENQQGVKLPSTSRLGLNNHKLDAKINLTYFWDCFLCPIYYHS